jgi:hypothetical protein
MSQIGRGHGRLDGRAAPEPLIRGMNSDPKDPLVGDAAKRARPKVRLSGNKEEDLCGIAAS